MSKEFKKVISEIFRENGVRSLLLKADHFGTKETIEYILTENRKSYEIGFGKAVQKIKVRRFIKGEVAKQMCYDFVMNRLQKEIDKKDKEINVETEFESLLKTLGLKSD